MKIIVSKVPQIVFCELFDSNHRDIVTASISARDITKNMVRCKSSNIWSYALNVKSNKNDKCKISVIMPCYNTELYIKECLN